MVITMARITEKPSTIEAGRLSRSVMLSLAQTEEGSIALSMRFLSYPAILET
jgi:hypothetical protein